MFRTFKSSLVLLCYLVVSGTAFSTDIFEFFEEEARVLQIYTASRLPLSIRQAPATVYVVTGEEIRQMGARTLWDALRGIPGVDVMTTRTFYSEVSIRGLNRPLSNRTLVLLDGRSVLNGPFDTAYWEGIPVVLDEIERIEIVIEQRINLEMPVQEHLR